MASDANSQIGRSPAPLDELEIKQEELRVRRVEADAALAAARSRRSRLSDPLVLAIIAAVISLLGNIAVAIYNNKSTLAQEKIKAEHDLDLQQKKASYSLVLQAMATNDIVTAKRNIQFFVDAGLLQDSDCRISEAAERYDPVLPSVSGTTPALPGVYSPLDIARLYNFPTWLDGRGQTIGILEFGGGIGRTDLASYFGTLNLPVPDVTAVSIDSGREQPDPMVDGEVMSNIEIAGAIAPKARIRVYFAAADSESGWEDAINRAGDDHVSIFFIGWGEPESRWTDKHINEVNMALRELAQRGVTILVAAGDNGVTDGVDDKHRHVDFPASSPWVLAIGGTNLQAADARIVSEAVWKTGDTATGGGLSQRFGRPDWQSAVPVPTREDGGFGRGIPDVVAAADPTLGIGIRADGRMVKIGGTTESVALWAGLLALINQGLGRNVGYLNPILYQEIGPAGVLRPVTKGDNGNAGVAGFKAGPGWTPVAGWGSPDGIKLLTWLREHPEALPGTARNAYGCTPRPAHAGP